MQYGSKTLTANFVKAVNQRLMFSKTYLSWWGKLPAMFALYIPFLAAVCYCCIIQILLFICILICIASYIVFREMLILWYREHGNLQQNRVMSEIATGWGKILVQMAACWHESIYDVCDASWFQFSIKWMCIGLLIYFLLVKCNVCPLNTWLQFIYVNP